MRKIFEAPKGKTRNVSFYTIEKIEKQSLETLCSSHRKDILTAD